MAIKYAVQKTQTGKEKKEYYYARAEYDGVTSMEDMAKMVEKISAISVGDVLSVLNTLGQLVAIELANGRIVDLGDLGRLRLSLRAKGMLEAEKVTRETILATRAIFVPGPAIRLKQRNLKFALTSAEPQPRKPEDKPHDEPTQPSNPPTPPSNGGGNGGEDQTGM